MSQQRSVDAGEPVSRIKRAARHLWARYAALASFDGVAIVLLAVVAAVALTTFGHYSVSNDEEVQQRYGALIVAYYRSGFVDQALFHYQNLYLYGGLFDIIAVLLQQIVPLDPYTVRHLLCGAFGIGGLIATWATARAVGGPCAGLIAVALLAVTGPWFGSMFNHTKDIPFASAMMGATYFLLLIGRSLPRPRPAHIVWFGILLGAALGLRVLALLLVGYAGVAVLLHMPRPFVLAGASRFVFRSALAFLPALALGYLIMIAAWPWAALAPLNPLRGLTTFSHFQYGIETVIAGQVYPMANVPRWYVPVYLAIKLPIPLLLGAILALAWLARPRAYGCEANLPNRRDVLLITAAALVPLFCQVVTEGPAFTGMRHFLFVVPPLAVLAGVGWDRAIAWLGRQRNALAWTAGMAVAAALLWNATSLVRLHPYEYMYYNEFVGGLNGAAGRYVMDYWANSMREAVLDLEAYLDRTDPGWRARRKYVVSICSEKVGFRNVAAPALQLDDQWERADFFISSTHMNCDRLLPGKVIATVERLGVPIGVVKDHRAFKQMGVAHGR